MQNVLFGKIQLSYVFVVMAKLSLNVRVSVALVLLAILVFSNIKGGIVNSFSQEDKYLTLQYMYPWPPYDLKPKWLSAMAQAESSAVLLKAYEITGERKYIDTAKNLLNVLFLEVKDGGVTYKTDSDGWWFELFAQNGSDKEPRVLNGMLISVLAIYDYYNYTKDTDAKYLFDKGVLALKKSLPKYDYQGTYTFYDLCCGNLTPVVYHEIVLSTLSELYNITKDSVFKSYYDKWSNYTVPDKLLKTKSEPGPRLIYDNGVPILDYKHVAGIYIGLQWNPVTIAHYAENYYKSYKATGNEKSKNNFLNCADWLMQNSVPLNTSKVSG